MFFCRNEHALPGFPISLLSSSVGKGESRAVLGQENSHRGRVSVHKGFFSRTVGDAQHAHAVILKLRTVMPRVHLEGIRRYRSPNHTPLTPPRHSQFFGCVV